MASQNTLRTGKIFISKIKDTIIRTFGLKTPVSFIDLFQIGLTELTSWNPQNKKEDGLIDVIDFFSGCGGMSLGFAALSQKEKIFNIKGGIDISEDALKSYANNFSSAILNHNIRELYSNDDIKLIKNHFGIKKTNKGRAKV